MKKISQRSIHRKLKIILNKDFTPHIILALLAFLAYGMYVSWMGFYWDDWPIVWLSEISGPESLTYYAFHRPLMGIFLRLGMSLFGTSPIAWQIQMVLLRLFSGLTSFYLINSIWPNKRTKAFLISAVILVFPGFTQQFVSLNSAGHILGLSFAFASLSMMLAAQHKHGQMRAKIFLSIVLALFGMLLTEYYYGLELFRPLLLWFYLKKQGTQNKEIIRRWLPYFILLSLFVWRAYVTQLGNYQFNLYSQIIDAPLINISNLVNTIFRDMYTSTFGAWNTAINSWNQGYIFGRSILYFWGIVLFVAIAIFVYLNFTYVKQKRDHLWARQAIGLGFLALLLGGLPNWITGLELGLSFPKDRLLLPMIFGSSLILIGLIELIRGNNALKSLIFSVIIASSLGFHFQNAIAYRIDWKNTSSFFNQLAARIPDIADGTTLISEEFPIKFSTDNSLTAPLNWIFAPDFSPKSDYYEWHYLINDKEELPLIFRYLDLRLGWQLPYLNSPQNYSAPYRFFTFNGSNQDILLLYYKNPYCLRILDSQFDQFHPHFLGKNFYNENPESLDKIFSPIFPVFPDLTIDALPFSSTKSILVDTPSNLINLPDLIKTGDEDWCTLFQKAELARQQKNWNEIVEIGKTAFSIPDVPRHASELTVFIEGYANSGRFDTAVALSNQAIIMDSSMQLMLCSTWERIDLSQIPQVILRSVMQLIEQDLSCD